MVNETELSQFRRVRRNLRYGAWLWLCAQLAITVLFAIGPACSFGYPLNLLTFLRRAFESNSDVLRMLLMIALSVLYAFVLVRMLLGCIHNIRHMCSFSSKKLEEKYPAVTSMNERFGEAASWMIILMFAAELAHPYELPLAGVSALILCAAAIFIGTFFDLRARPQAPSALFTVLYMARVLFIFAMLYVMGVLLFRQQFETVMNGIRTVLRNKWDSLNTVLYMIKQYLFTDIAWIVITVIYLKIVRNALNSVEGFEGHPPTDRSQYSIAHGTAEWIPTMWKCFWTVCVLAIVKCAVGLLFTGESTLGDIDLWYAVKRCVTLTIAREIPLMLTLAAGIMMFNIRFVPGDEVILPRCFRRAGSESVRGSTSDGARADEKCPGDFCKTGHASEQKAQSSAENTSTDERWSTEQWSDDQQG